MPEKIFVDTGGFFAFLNADDPDHKDAVRRLQDGKKITTNYVFDELVTLLAARGKRDLSVAFGEQLRTGRMVTVHFVTPREEEKAWQVYKKYRDHPLSFTDCTTLMMLRQHRIPDLLSYDGALLKAAKNIS